MTDRQIQRMAEFCLHRRVSGQPLSEVIGAERVWDANSCGGDGGIGKMVADGLLIGGEEFGEAELVVDWDVHPGTTREGVIGSATGILNSVIGMSFMLHKKMAATFRMIAAADA